MEVVSRTLPIREVIWATPRSCIVRVAVDAEGFEFEAGQAVSVVGPADGKRRTYSIAVSPEEATRDGFFELLVASDPTKPGTLAMSAGHSVTVEGPVGNFSFPDDPPERRFVFVAGGTGIAPLRAMLRKALSIPDSEVHVLYSARTCDDFAYQQELRDLERDGRIRLRETVTRDSDDNWKGDRGRIGRAHLEPLTRDRAALWLICGPMSLVADTQRILTELGVGPEQVRVEEWQRIKTAPMQLATVAQSDSR